MKFVLSIWVLCLKVESSENQPKHNFKRLFEIRFKFDVGVFYTVTPNILYILLV